MSQFRMSGPNYRPRKSPHTTRNRIIGWVLQVIAFPMMVVLPWVFLGLPIDGIGYLAGQGEEITVTVVESSRSNANGIDDPGWGYYSYSGEQRRVELDQVEEGEKLPARVAVTSEPGAADTKAYVSSWAAIGDTIWGAIFMAGSVSMGLGLWRSGRGIRQ